MLLHPRDDEDRVGAGIAKLGIKNLKEIEWCTLIFDYHGFDFDELVKTHPLWNTQVHEAEKLM